MIPGARGCTPQTCSFRDHFAELEALGVDHLFGLSTQDPDYQREAAERLHLPFAILSDERLELTTAMGLPTFETSGMTLLKRFTLVIDDGTVEHVFYPVFPPDRSASDVIDWLSQSQSPATGGPVLTWSAPAPRRTGPRTREDQLAQAARSTGRPGIPYGEVWLRPSRRDRPHAIADGCRASGVTAISMKGKSGRVDRMSWSSSWLSTSKTEKFEYCPAIRQRCTHLPLRCSSWARAFSSAFSRSISTGSMPCGGRTSILTWYSTMVPLVARVVAQPVLVERDADAGPARQMHVEVLEAQRLGHELAGQDLRAEVLAAPR